MLVIYSPEGASPREWEFKPDEAWSFETELIESVGGQTWLSWDGFLAMLGVDNTKAQRALLWMLLRRDDPKLRFSDLVIKRKELSIGPDLEERRELRRRLADPDAAWSEIDRLRVEDELAKYPDDEDEPEPVGKDEPDDSATDGPSPTS